MIWCYYDWWNVLKKLHIERLEWLFVPCLLTMELSTWHHHMACWPKLDGLLPAIPTWPPWPAWPNPYQWCTMCFFRKKSQFFPKHISLTVDTKELIQFEVQLTGKCQVEKYLYNQLQSPSRSRFIFQRMVSCASSTSDSQTTCRRAPVACVVPWEAPDNIDFIIHGP